MGREEGFIKRAEPFSRSTEEELSSYTAKLPALLASADVSSVNNLLDKLVDSNGQAVLRHGLRQRPMAAAHDPAASPPAQPGKSAAPRDPAFKTPTATTVGASIAAAGTDEGVPDEDLAGVSAEDFEKLKSKDRLKGVTERQLRKCSTSQKKELCSQFSLDGSSDVRCTASPPPAPKGGASPSTDSHRPAGGR
jgi:hypothetical protein